MESPLPPTPRRLTRPGLAAAVLAAALLAGCSTTQGGTPRAGAAPEYVPIEIPLADAGSAAPEPADAGFQAPLPEPAYPVAPTGPLATRAPAPRTTRAPASGPAPRVDTSPVFAPRRQGGTMDPGSRYLPHVDPVGSEPAETPPLDVR
ncbi:MAG: hypothetical protein H6806_02115 [Planctomycetes bacterium]|nr:hypothetical protein [Planctomycetota bacterium]MCB9828546.1 hypothetical protein [Planctomycetota bacterium]MCB9900313.1 hypothetical protein [Planctomycetota bacterium]